MVSATWAKRIFKSNEGIRFSSMGASRGSIIAQNGRSVPFYEKIPIFGGYDIMPPAIEGEGRKSP
jgi:hypothetical protein